MAKDGRYMSKGKAFVVAGHSHWGKSFTLSALTERYGGGRHKRSVTIRHEMIPVKKMSNDDKPVDELIGFIKKHSDGSRCIIIPLCPKFSEEHRRDTERLIESLREFYEAYFMVLKKAQGDGDSREIQDSEVLALRSYGCVEIISEKLDEYARAERFKDFIEKYLCAHNKGDTQ